MRAIVRGRSLGTGAILVADQLFDDQAKPVLHTEPVKIFTAWCGFAAVAAPGTFLL